MTTAAPDPPRQPKRARLDLVVAVIAATAGIAGAGVGGAASYFGSAALDRSHNRDAARGAARVLENQLYVVEVRFDGMLTLGRLAQIDNAFRFSTPPDDAKLIAGALTNDEWQAVSSAKAVVSLYATRDDKRQRRADAHQRVPLTDKERHLFQETIAALEKGIAALRRVGDFK